MQDAPIKEKQQIIDKIKAATNIMITVSRDPSVDDLSAALGLTMLLNKVGKHATAIFSGAIPPAITFLEPDKIFENSIDSLRDFIIALDKEKADHLRYKVDGDAVKIFITPYRTVISDKDLEFSQGDYNVELVMALGVENQDHLDLALAAHGQILHDVPVVTLSTGKQVGRLGILDWYDPSSSCLSEMITSLSDSLKTDKPLLDKQVATALLTGIVAATERFSNIKTSASTMTLAAQLMAAGADQQLIASKLKESHQINALSSVPSAEEPLGDDIESPSPAQNILSISHGLDDSQSEVSTVQAPVLSEPVVIAEPTSTLPPDELLDPKIIPDSKSHVISGGPDDISDINSSGINVNQTQLAEVNVGQPAEGASFLAHSPSGGSVSTTIAPPVNISSVGDGKLLDILNNESDGVSTLPPSETPITTNFSSPEPLTATPSVELPLPPPIPNYFASTPPPIADFGATISSDKPLPTESITSDPAQFKIPGQ